MKAKEARELTLNALNGPAIERALKYIYKKISTATAEGKYEIAHPFSGMTMEDHPHKDQQEAIWLSLQQDGFKVIHHPGPPEPNYNDFAYTSINW